MDVTLTPCAAPKDEQKVMKPLAIDALIARTRFLPPAFELIPRLLLLLDDSDANCEDLAAIIRVDPGLTADVLRISNSASFGGGTRTAGLAEGIMRVGLREVYRIVVQIVASSALNAANTCGSQRVTLWQHSLATAVSAQALARHLSEEDPEVVFSAALLHDIGKAVLAEAAGGFYGRLLDHALKQNESVDRLEREHFGIDHTQVAERLLRVWRFPAPVVEGIGRHHSPLNTRKENAPMAALLHAGNALAYHIGYGNGFPPHVVEPDPTALSLLGLDRGDLRNYRDEAADMLRREQERFQ